LTELDARLKKLTRALNAYGAKQPGVVVLRSIPGVGPRTAEAVLAYLDDVHRFGRVKGVASYFGLIPCQDQSAGSNRLGHITRQGPGSVRKLLVEAAWQGIRHSPTIQSYFARIRGEDPDRRKIALVATAHYLVRVMFSLLRTGECWRERAIA
jgi:transposase